MSKIGSKNVNIKEQIFEGLGRLKSKVLPKLDAKKMEQLPDEFLTEAEKFKHDPDVKAYNYIKSEDGKSLIERIKSIYANITNK